MKKLYQMKISKLLNKKSLSIILIFFFLFNLKVYSEEPVDIWNVDLKKIIIESSNKEKVEQKKQETKHTKQTIIQNS